MKLTHRELTKKEYTRILEEEGLRQVGGHGGSRTGGATCGHPDAPPTKFIQHVYGNMKNREIKKDIHNGYANTEAIRSNFMAYKNTCNITGIRLDTKNYPLSLDRKVDNLSNPWRKTPHSSEHCQLLNRYINFAKGRHEAFKSDLALTEYCLANKISGSSMYEVTCAILRPIIEDMINHWKTIRPVIVESIQHQKSIKAVSKKALSKKAKKAVLKKAVPKKAVPKKAVPKKAASKNATSKKVYDSLDEESSFDEEDFNEEDSLEEDSFNEEDSFDEEDSLDEENSLDEEDLKDED